MYRVKSRQRWRSLIIGLKGTYYIDVTAKGSWKSSKDLLYPPSQRLHIHTALLRLPHEMPRLYSSTLFCVIIQRVFIVLIPLYYPSVAYFSQQNYNYYYFYIYESIQMLSMCERVLKKILMK